MKYTEQELKAMSIPEFVKWLCGLAEGFCVDENMIRVPNGYYYHIDEIVEDKVYLPLLIHRAIEGFNNNQQKYQILTDHCSVMIYERTYVKHMGRNLFSGYQPESLTYAECAKLHCLIERFKER